MAIRKAETVKEVSASVFNCTAGELRKLMEQRGEHGYSYLQRNYGGVQEICKRLLVSPNEG